MLDDLEEIFEDEGFLALYQVGWSMSGRVPRADPSFELECHAAFAAFCASHPELVLVSMRWPLKPAEARRCAADVNIELDVDPDAVSDVELLALMDPSGVSV